MPVTGPDFVSLQVRDLAASQAFYERYLGLERAPAGPPHAVVFTTTPIAFALRDLVEGTDLGASASRCGCTPPTCSRSTTPASPTATPSPSHRSTAPSAARARSSTPTGTS